MKSIYNSSLNLYINVLNIHIKTKTSDVVFHQVTEEFYEKLFDVSHKIGEKIIDLGWKLEFSNIEDSKEKTVWDMKEYVYKGIDSLIKEIENYKKNNEVSLWTEDLLWSIANELEEMRWTAKAFIL